MLRIAICEDDLIELDILKDLINDYVYYKKCQADIKIYTDALSILAEDQNFDIYLLDIVLPGDIDGIKLGRLIRSQDRIGNIIYVSGESKYAIEAYKLRALSYILKPIDRNELFELLDICYEQAKKNRFILKTPAGQKRIAVNDLAYVNIGRRNLIYHLRDGTNLEGLNIRTNFETELQGLIADDTFCFLRPSLLVNISEVELLDKNIITFKQGDQIKLSAPQLKEFKKAWTFGCIII